MNQYIRILIIAVVLAALAVVGVAVTYYTDWLWFTEVGYASVFVKILVTKFLLWLIFSLLFFGIFYLNMLLARRLKPRFRVAYEAGFIRLNLPFLENFLDRIVLAAAVFLSLVAGSAASGYWEKTLLFLNGTAFGARDPIFGYDLSFFVFRLPFWRFLWGFFFIAILVSLLFTIVVHILGGSIRLVPGEQMFSPHVKAHISSLGAVICVMFALGFRLLQYGLLYSSRGVAFGASYTDVHAELPVYWILAVVSLITAALFLVNIYFKGWRLPAIGLGILVSALVVTGGIYPAIVQQYQVAPNEIAMERPYIKRNIQFTRLAYGLDKIKSRPYTVSTDLTAAVVEDNRDTVDNVRLWDWKPVLKTYNQLQAMRLYYDFNDVDIDRYTLGSKYTQVTLAARELNTAQLPDTAKTWLNQHIVYTHGYGVVMNPVNRVSTEGLPDMIVKNIPPRSDVLTIDRPEIYFGELTNDYVFVDTKTAEFDYPKGDKNQYTSYKGKAGIPLSFFSRLMFAARFSSLQMLVSSTLTADSKVLFRRNITERTDAIAPFLYYDSDPYIVAAPGPGGSGSSDKDRLYWIYDAYTTTSMYPYSRPFQSSGLNYIRNSVKVVVDAYDGTTNFYVVDDKDPLAKTYAKIFPKLFKPASAMPGSLKKHWRYPEDLFSIQASMYATYHMLDPQVFYNKEDTWQLAKETASGGTAQAMTPYYMIMRLPGETEANFRLITPFTPTNKNNMVAWLSAGCDGADYGRLFVYTFGKERLVFGPLQIEARINQDPTISQFLTLVSQRGSTVSKGPLLVIPLGGSLIYVQPLYIQAQQSELPELKRVFVSYGDKVVMTVSFAEALNQLFGVNAPATTAPSATTGQPAVTGASTEVSALIDEAVAHYNKAIEAQKNGDWTTYGLELKLLEDTLNKLRATKR